MTVPAALFESYTHDAFGASWRFDELVRVVKAAVPEEVVPALAAVEGAAAEGLHAAGFIAYEAAHALNPALPPSPPVPGLPFLWFGLFRERTKVDPPVGADPCVRPPDRPMDYQVSTFHSPVKCGDLTPDETAYAAAVAAIHAAIARGETYQVNYTLRRRFGIEGDPFALYRRLAAAQRAPFCAWLDTGGWRILSASPELFFARRGERIVMRPMKGTASREPEAGADRIAAEALRSDPKERAENLMIVDLVRNDLGALAQTGSVRVESLFAVETYPTVHQMTSTIGARLLPGTTLKQILAALFPCGSVTGAPKRRTMELIRRLEGAPRGIYCGAIGFLSPGDEAVFSVAIRTVVVDAAGNAELGLGSGITWDAQADAEYAECLAKARFLDAEPQDFRLIEALLCRDGIFPRLERHMARLAASAGYFDFRCDAAGLRAVLLDFGAGLSGAYKVRLLLARDGSCELASEPLARAAARPLQVALAAEPVDSRDVLRYHKTERRELLDAGRRRHPQADEVLFVNERGELTEGSYHNVVLRLDDALLTPALSCGLLPGVLRGELLERGALREAVLTVADLERADGFWLINAVRGWRRGILV